MNLLASYILAALVREPTLSHRQMATHAHLVLTYMLDV